MIKGLVNLPCKEGLKELGTFSLKRQGSADVITVLQYFNDSYKEDEVSLITKTQVKKTRCSAYKLNQGGFLSVEEEIFYCKKNHSLERPLQGHGRVPITEGFQDGIGQAR